MPDGTMKLGGEAVAEVLRRVPVARWATPCLDFHVFGARPFQAMLDLAYRALDDVRPILGCESCGRPKPWVRPAGVGGAIGKPVKAGACRPERRCTSSRFRRCLREPYRDTGPAPPPLE